MTWHLGGGTLIDGTGVDPVRADVSVDGTRIGAVGSAPRGEAIDVTGLTVLPGLIDGHVHLDVSSDIRASIHGEISVAERAADIFNNCTATLMAGFTTVRDTGGIDDGLVRTIETGRIQGPRILHCGPIICQRGGHGHFQTPFQRVEDLKVEVLGLYGHVLLTDGPDEMRRSAREAFRRGASFLKLCVTGGGVSLTDSLDDTQFQVDEIAAAVAEANARHTYVTVHAHNNEGIRNAIAAGVRCVEHGSRIDDETAELMAANDVALMPTLAVAEKLAEDPVGHGLPPQIGDRVRSVMAGMADAILAARKAGVLVGSGSDLIGPLQDRRGLELVLKAKIIGPMEAIVSATKVNAEILRISDDVGTVETGKRADLIAVDFDPVSEPHLWEDADRVKLVVKAGQIVKDTR
ncbi:amidohydrolase family protein [Amycolatopsis japonica]|uniref:metal-dependent hydrolase family protein n=1 Tax=Amycolatopsis japonica TaxID=208439 RepID=UPI00366BA7EA